MKKTTNIWTTEDAVRLLHKGGVNDPSESRVEVMRRLLHTCEDNVSGFTGWNEPLYPKLDDLEDVDLVIAMEKEFGIAISDAELESASLKTFGDLLLFVEAYLSGVLRRRAREAAHLASPNCATQTAFYILRRRLCDAGASSDEVHNLRPQTRFLPLSPQQIEAFTDDLWADYGLTGVTDRFLWGRSLRTDDVQTAFLLVTALISLFVTVLSGDFILFTAIVSTLIWIGINVVFARLIDRYSQHKLNNNQTLGDVARKIAATVPPVGAVQAAS